MPILHFDFWTTAFLLAVALLIAIAGALLLVAYLDSIPMSVNFGWGWVALVLLIPVFGPLWFCHQHWQVCHKTGKQLIAGLALLLLAMALLYGLGPFFAARSISRG